MASNAPIDLRRLDYFVRVVDAPALKDAAIALCLTQQALSSAIRQLEEEIGVKLFSRDGRSLRTTAAGRELYTQAKGLLAGGRQAVAATRRAADDQPRQFTIGHTSTISNHEVYNLVASIEMETRTQVQVAQILPESTHDALLNGSFDVVLRRGLHPSPSFATAIVGYHELRVAVSSEHALAAETALSFRDLSAYPIVLTVTSQSQYHDYLVSLCRRNGFDPTVIVDTIRGASPSTSVISHREACALVTDPAGEACGGRVRVVPFDDPPLVPLQAVWLPHTASEFREQLLGQVGAASLVEDLPA